MIRLKNIFKSYGSENVKCNALKGITLTIDTGEYLAIMGPSGSGKTTLLNILGGIDRADSGEYLYDNLKVNEMTNAMLHKFRRDHVSFVFQNFELINYYTVFENVEMPLFARRMSASQRKKKVCEALELAGIESLRKKLPIHISGGERQRCAIARALVSDNNLLLADEPTGALDIKTGEGIMRVFDNLKKTGRTIVLITHNPDVAGRADRIVNISDGNIV